MLVKAMFRTLVSFRWQRIVVDDLQRAGARLEIDGVETSGADADEEFTSPGGRAVSTSLQALR